MIQLKGKVRGGAMQDILSERHLKISTFRSRKPGVINNGKKEEPAEKASVLDQLKEKQEAVPPAPPRRCCEEKEL